MFSSGRRTNSRLRARAEAGRHMMEPLHSSKNAVHDRCWIHQPQPRRAPDQSHALPAPICRLSRLVHDRLTSNFTNHRQLRVVGGVRRRRGRPPSTAALPHAREDALERRQLLRRRRPGRPDLGHPDRARLGHLPRERLRVFVDPDGDTHTSLQIEVNTLGAAWDLMLPQPYRDGGRRSTRGTSRASTSASTCAAPSIAPAIRRGLDRRDRDAVADTFAAAERRRRTRHWRVNFTRSVAGRRRRGPLRERVKPARRSLPEQLVSTRKVDQHAHARTLVHPILARAHAPTGGLFVDDPNERSSGRFAGSIIVSAHRAANGAYASRLDALEVADIRVDGLEFHPVMHSTPSFYEIVAARLRRRRRSYRPGRRPGMDGVG